MALVVRETLNSVQIGNIDLIFGSDIINKLPILLFVGKAQPRVHASALPLDADIVMTDHPNVRHRPVIDQGRQFGITENILFKGIQYLSGQLSRRQPPAPQMCSGLLQKILPAQFSPPHLYQRGLFLGQIIVHQLPKPFRHMSLHYTLILCFIFSHHTS